MYSDSSHPLDVLIVGLGIMGSASFYNLASKKISVLAIDQYLPPHIYGSSHGETRIIRKLYFEHPLYVPLIERAYHLWQDLESKTGSKLFLKTGGLYLGPEHGSLIKGIKSTASEHKFKINLLSNEEVSRSYPAFRAPKGMVGIYEEDAGILFPERCVEAFLTEGVKKGGNLQFGVKVQGFREVNLNGEKLVEVETTNGRWFTRKLVLSAGAYITELLSSLSLTVERKSIYWITPTATALPMFQPPCFPIFIIDDDRSQCSFSSSSHPSNDGSSLFPALYGFPDLGEGVKTAFHVDKRSHGEGRREKRMKDIRREVDKEEEKDFMERISIYLPQIEGGRRRKGVCLYTMTEDEHFIIDFFSENVVVCSACSGHGFKFGSVVGEIIRDLCLKGESKFDLQPFKLDRGKPKL